MNHFNKLLTLSIAFGLLSFSSYAQSQFEVRLHTKQEAQQEPQQETQAPQPHRKKVGLVLSGGGAKGVAHIGVLKVLEEVGIPIDYIAGTSMGSIVGGLYAIGYSPNALDSIMRAQDWMALLADQISRNNLLFTERETSEKTLLTVPFDREKFHFSTGFLSGGAVMHMLSEFTIGYHNMKSFNDLPIPFACVAYDLVSGQEVVMREGSLPLAIRASMSIPGAFSTVERNGCVLIDGGVINNFPVDIIRQMGADIVIGVDVSFLTDEREKGAPDADTPANKLQESMPHEDINSISFIVRQLMDRMGREKFDLNKQFTDLYLHPNTDSYSTASFTSTAIDSLIIRGERVARENYDALLAFKELIGIQPNESYKFPPNRPAQTDIPISDSLKVGEIFFEGLTSLRETNLRRMLHFKENSTITLSELDEAMNRLKGTGGFSSIQFSMLDYDGRYDILFTCKERSQSAVHLGVRFDSRDIAAGYLKVNISPKELKGATLDLSGRLSTNPYASVGLYYQDAWLGRFGLSYRYRHANLTTYSIGDTTSQAARFHLHRVNADIANFYYRNFNIWVNMRYEQYMPQSAMLLMNSALNRKKNENLFIYSGGVNYDNFDDAYYPHRGVRFNASYSLFTDNFTHYKDNLPFASIAGKLYTAIPFGERFTFVPGVYGRFLWGEETAALYQNYVGGTMGSLYLDHQMPFYGFKPLAVVDNKFLAVSVEARYRLGGNHYVWAKANAARVTHTIADMIIWDQGDYMLGGALGYSFRTPLGPIDAVLEYGLHPGAKYGFYLNFGKYF